MDVLTQKRVKEIFDYDPDTGVFTWADSRNNHVKIGDVAGFYHPSGYRSLQISKVKYYAHRLAWLYVYGELPEEIDHINQIKDDNRIENLRVVDRSANMQNAPIRKDNKSGCHGVSHCLGKWRARIVVNKKEIYLGSYVTKSEAIAKRKIAEVIYGFHPNHGCAA